MIVFVSIVTPQVLYAKKISSSIHSISYGERDQFHLVRFDNARVGFLDPRDKSLEKAILFSSKKQDKIEVLTDKNNKIISAKSIYETESEDDIEYKNLWKNDSFNPSVVRSYDRALTIFNRMRRDYSKDGECFNRAHIWSYEEYKRSGLNSMKVFMFFTERYIRRYNFGWWFHVTPMVYVSSKGSPYALDRRYTSGPRQTKTWSDIFIKTKLRCPKVKMYDDFWLNQKRNDCYHMHTSMYYVIPRDIEKRDLTGIEKSEFNESEIRKAYKNGFNKIVLPGIL